MGTLQYLATEVRFRDFFIGKNRIVFVGQRPGSIPAGTASQDVSTATGVNRHAVGGNQMSGRLLTVDRILEGIDGHGLLCQLNHVDAGDRDVLLFPGLVQVDSL